MVVGRESREYLAQALRERERRLARRSFRKYIELTMPSYEFNWHHERIIEELEMVEAGARDRLMIVTPPRHGKSTLCSVLFPAWYIGRNPRNQIIAASYGGELSDNFGNQLRNRMREEEHMAIFGDAACLSTESQARDKWTTNAGGVYRSAGVGGGITGFGAHLGIIDDPVKGWEEANSDLIQRRNVEWYRSDFYTRLMPPGAVVVIQTRWHENDLAGHLLDKMENEHGDRWHVIHFPAIDENGNALWESEYPVSRLEKIRSAVGSTTWNALYQGDPTPVEGTHFLREHLKGYERMPDLSRMVFYGASDYAVTENGGDWTVHVVVGLDEHENIYVLDYWRGQTGPDIWIERKLDLMERWKTMNWAAEGGQIYRSIGPFLKQRQKERKIYGKVETFTSSTNKVQRSRSMQARMAMGKVLFPRQAPWWPDVENELLKFPYGKNDDIVDTLSLVGTMLDQMAKGRKKPARAERPKAMNIGNVGMPKGFVPITYGEIYESEMNTRWSEMQ